jgi:hypothetical protein
MSFCNTKVKIRRKKEIVDSHKLVSYSSVSYVIVDKYDMFKQKKKNFIVLYH